MKAVQPNTPPDLAAKIRELIQTGHYGPGDHLGTVELAERFGVSRGPVREALRLLESLNLIRVVPQKGAFVVALEDQEVQDVLGVREVLFAMLAERSAVLATDEDHKALYEQLDLLSALARDTDVQPRAFQEASYAYVGILFRAAHNQRLVRLINDLTEGAGALYGHLSFATREMRQAELRGYQALTRAIVAGQPQKAFSLAREMHSRGVERARELHALMPGRASGQVLRGRRTRRAAHGERPNP
ncbi:GntR family transcriptional regulator [Brevundimonas sp.]|jgi:DNA-binding GntR family transcriptional regulator|uniref:GntR family transcriptional regulator n=1 Tax=Brevundimonas sp. TaxID=1871086 RepID=UPI0039191693|nr:GntR family transcriptional regulator [Brevundimonas sp.]MCA3716799.1 GntR family transcriptional regulator [Brevundimonas sp.]